MGIQQGLQEGLQQGLQQGLQDQCEMLLGLLQQKFNEIPQTYQQKLTQADKKTLKIWWQRVWPAKTVEEVFAE